MPGKDGTGPFGTGPRAGRNTGFAGAGCMRFDRRCEFRHGCRSAGIPGWKRRERFFGVKQDAE